MKNGWFQNFSASLIKKTHLTQLEFLTGCTLQKR